MNSKYHFTLAAALVALAAAPVAHAQTFFANNTTISSAVTGDAALGFTGKDSSGNYVGPTSPTITLNTGGSVDYFLNAYNGSTLIQNGGTIFGDVYAFDSSTLIFGGGTVKGNIFAYTNSTLDFEGNLTQTAATSAPAGFSGILLTGTLADTTAINKTVYLHNGSNARLTLNKNINLTGGPTVTPEPGNVALLLGMSVTGVGFLVRRRKAAKSAA